MTMLSHPVGAMILASFVALALLPELEWWVVLLAVGVTYLVFAITGMIESNLEHKRKKVEEDKKKKE
jgi:amino acid transporter